ncbi:hypothetical protein NUSPORA_01984 [Nucleospora cyclopteri]
MFAVLHLKFRSRITLRASLLEERVPDFSTIEWSSLDFSNFSIFLFMLSFQGDLSFFVEQAAKYICWAAWRHLANWAIFWLSSGGCRRTWSPITESIRFNSSTSTLLEGIFLVRFTLVISISFSSLIFESTICLILRYCMVSRKEIELP